MAESKNQIRAHLGNVVSLIDASQIESAERSLTTMLQTAEVWLPPLSGELKWGPNQQIGFLVALMQALILLHQGAVALARIVIVGAAGSL